MAKEVSALVVLARNLLSQAELFEQHLVDNNLPLPGFAAECPASYQGLITDSTVLQARSKIVNDARKIVAMMNGSFESVRMTAMQDVQFLGAMLALVKFKVPEAVPLDGEISLEKLAQETGMSLDMLTRLVRFVATQFVFIEHPQGIIKHSVKSKQFATEEGAKAFIQFTVTEAMPSASKWAEALQKSPSGEVCPFELAFGIPFFEHKRTKPEANAVFAKVMAGSKKDNRGEEASSAYDWKRLSGTLVDVGGGIGHIALPIAKQNPELKVIIEDLENLTDQAEEQIKEEGLENQVSFVSHDFFQPQPEVAKGASVYFLSHVLHDWPDDKCILIMKHVIEAMRPDSKILLLESLLPTLGQLPPFEEGAIRAQDLGMFSFLKAKERNIEDLTKLLQMVDNRLEVTDVVGPPKMKKNSIVEYGFESK